MSLRQYWRDVRHRFNHYVFEDFPVEGAVAAEQYAKAAYSCCVTWYGPPLDAQKPYCVAQAVEGNSFCTQIFGKYYLAISKDASTPEQLRFNIAHEMFHRVTAGRGGLAGEMWVQEMMAILSSHWFLRRQGFTEYADAVKKQWLAIPGKAEISLLRASRRQRGTGWLLLGRAIYSAEFVASIGRIAYALIRLVDGDDLCRIIKAATIEEWVASLPREKQYGVSRLLEVASDGKKVPESNHDLYQFCNALAAKGDQALVVSEFVEITRLQPINSSAFFHLGRAYQWAKEFEAAQASYLKALELGLHNDRLCYYLGTTYWHRNEFASSAKWFQQAIELNSDWASAHYYLADSLCKAGDLDGARTAWEKVLPLPDEHYVKLAQKALQENLLPTDTAFE